MENQPAVRRPQGLERFGMPAPERDDLSGHAHRQLIGFLGLALPVLLWIIGGARPTVDAAGNPVPLDSVSAYYYSGAVVVFVGLLCVLAVYLFTYEGYANHARRRDRIAAVIAGGAAVLVAFFPTEPPPGVARPTWWTEAMGTAHFAAAIVLFGSFIFYSFFLFPKSKKGSGERLPTSKRVRNTIYYLCGAGMLLSVGWAIAAHVADAPIFWPEILALGFFAVSWLAKGRVERAAVAALKGTRYYATHPRDLPRDVWSGLGAPPTPARPAVDPVEATALDSA